MCLDPRPESLVRYRPATRRRPGVDSLSDVTTAPRAVPASAEASLRRIAGRDDLDARGWTLLTRAAAW